MNSRSAEPTRRNRVAHLSLLAAYSLLIALAVTASDARVARATERVSPVKVTVELAPQTAAKGEAVPVVLVARSARSALVTGFRLESRNGPVQALSAPQTFSMSKGESRELRYEITDSQSEEPLRLQYSVNGKAQTMEIDLAAAAARPRVGQLVSAPDEAVFASSKASRSFEMPEPVPPPGPRLGKEREGGPTDTDTLGPQSPQYSITVTGRIVVPRTDGLTTGVDGASVSIYDEDWSWDEHLATDATDSNGDFSITFNWDPCGICDSTPDLYVYVEASNTEVQVQSTVWEINYSWEGRTYDDYSGTTLDVGWLQPESYRASLQILTSITRGWRWVLANRGYDLPPVDVQWPEPNSDGPSRYEPWWEEIHITKERSWNENTHLHEYGHHIMNKLSTYMDTDYCNNMCDIDPPDECSHCEWCPEDQFIAFKEGFAHWVGDVASRTWGVQYDAPPRHFDKTERIGGCFKMGGAHGNPVTTENFNAAVFTDIWDDTNEDDTYSDGFADALSLGSAEVLEVLDLDEPIHILGFLDRFRARFPQHTTELWETAMNNGINFDDDFPTTPPPFSVRHSVGVPSPDATVKIEWASGIDPTSGIGGYNVQRSTSGPEMPDENINTSSRGVYTETPPLEPGSYWFNIRAVDRAGNWDPDYEWYGPVIIREALPADLAMTALGGWDHPVVPRSSDDATMFDVQAPTTMLSTSNTWWNAAIINNGESDTPSGFATHIRVDGVYVDLMESLVPLEAYTVSLQINRGPLSISGGRHTFDGFVEAGELFPESNEVDNKYGHQWIWAPTPFYFYMSFDNPTPPPRRTGGWESVASPDKSYNCHGYRLITSPSMPNPIAGVYLVADNFHDDYDLRLHDEATSATSGFGLNIGWSDRPSACTDAVLVNALNRPADYYDIGVLNILDDLTDGYHIEALYATELTPDVPVNATIDAGDAMGLYMFDVVAPDEGAYSVYVEANVADGRGPLHLGWYDASFAVGPLDSHDVVDTTDALGSLRLDIANAGAGKHGLALWRDHKDGHLLETDYTITLRRTPADLYPYTPAGWAGPLVPRATGDATNAWAPAPTLLPGNAPATYLNSAAFNGGFTDATTFSVHALLDGLDLRVDSYPELRAGTFLLRMNSSGYTVRGGRHTLALSVDHDATQLELDEQNNIHGRQWVWDPLTLAMDATIHRSRPPEPTGGWDRVTTEDYLFYNCDGLRTPTFAPSLGEGNWGGVAVIPGSFSDVDLRLHPVSSGATDGFAERWVSSGWPTKQTDFVIVNLHRIPERTFDVGVVRGISSQTEVYRVQATQSSFLAKNPDGVYTGFSLDATELLQLHEVKFTMPGLYTITLTPEDVLGDLGISLYPVESDYFAKEDVFNGTAISWQAPEGEEEQITASIFTLGYYCIAVWRANRTGFGDPEDYQLTIAREPTGVDDPSLPQLTQIRGVHPNPFNPRTTVTFALAKAGPIDLQVFDTRGRLIKNLLSKPMPSGHHETDWDGQDDQGRSVASGTYFVRLMANGTMDRHKVLLLK